MNCCCAQEAKAEGSSVTVETCAHYLAFAAEDVPEGATQYKCAPPLRDSRHRELLWKALLVRTFSPFCDGTCSSVDSRYSSCFFVQAESL